MVVYPLSSPDVSKSLQKLTLGLPQTFTLQTESRSR